jgi:hypothetical protein
MATVYWFGNGGNWSDHTNHWSNNSGNSPASLHGAAPGTDDDAKFDVNSFNAGSQTVTVDATANCKSLDFTGATNSPTLAGSSNVNIYGNLTMISAMTTSGTGRLDFKASGTLTSNSHTFGKRVGVFGSGITVTLGDAFNSTTYFFALQGTFNTANYDMVTGIFSDGGSAGLTRVLTLGTSEITCSNWIFQQNGTTFTDNSGATINASGNFNNIAAGFTYGIVNLTSAYNGTTVISGSNTFDTLALPSGTTQTITFTDGTTQTATTFTLSGSAGHVHTLQGSSTGGWTITKAGGGTVTANYMSISYSTGSPGSTWYATNSTNGGNNSGWSFGYSYASTVGIDAAASTTRKLTYTRTSSAGIDLSSVVSYLAAYIRASTANLKLTASATKVRNRIVSSLTNLSLSSSVIRHVTHMRASSANIGVASVVSKITAYIRAATANLSLTTSVSKSKGMIIKATASIKLAVSAWFAFNFLPRILHTGARSHTLNTSARSNTLNTGSRSHTLHTGDL